MTISIQKPWSATQREHWIARQTQIRSYDEDVLTKLRELPSHHSITKYGQLSIDPESYPLFAVTIGDLHNGKPNALITAGVHGYEEGPVRAALKFLRNNAVELSSEFNLVIIPCVSPWAYEFHQRRNADGLDVNRNFKRDGKEQAEECIQLMDYVNKLNTRFTFAIDLHETTDDELQFEQDTAEIEGKRIPTKTDPVPNGYYVYVHPDCAESQLGHRITAEVAKVTPICSDTKIYGDRHDYGVLVPPQGIQGPCMFYTRQHAALTATTEVCTPGLSMEKRVEAQIASIQGAIEHIRALP